MAIGSRAGDPSGPVARRVASRVFYLAIRGALGLPFGDTQRGAQGVPAASGPADLQPGPSRRLRLRCRGAVAARQLGLEVTEVGVQAMEGQGSKVQMVADALEMLGEVWTVRQARTSRAHAEGDLPHPVPEGGGQRWRPPLGAATTAAGAPPAFQAS